MNTDKLVEIRHRILNNIKDDNLEVLWALNDLDTLIYKEENLIICKSCLLLNNSLKEGDTVIYNSEKFTINFIELKHKVADITSECKTLICGNVPLSKLTKIVL